MSDRSRLRFDHLDRLSDHRGLFEHALETAPRLEHGYCTDDNARLLVITSREPDSGIAGRLSRLALEFVLDAQTIGGRFHNRMDQRGRWIDTATTEDCWGRSVWALGVAATQHGDDGARADAQLAFGTAITTRSRWSRSMAFAALGAADVLAAQPDHRGAHALLVDALALIGPSSPSPGRSPWPWPQTRLTYANATLAEAVIAAGAGLDRRSDLDRGLAMLAWLLDSETASGHLSVTGSGGRGPGDCGPQFDQQPIEVAAMADACWRAAQVTGESSWLRGVTAAVAWFEGDNDTGAVMYDPISGGGFDGLHEDRVNRNQGAESTMAFVSTMQRGVLVAPAR